MSATANVHTVYRLTNWAGQPIEDSRYGDLCVAGADAMLWSAALGERIEIRDQAGVTVAWADLTTGEKRKPK